MGDLGFAPRSAELKVPYNHFYTNRPDYRIPSLGVKPSVSTL